MNKQYKLFALFAIIIMMMFSVKLYDEQRSTNKIKELSIKYEVESIADFLVAFRTTYQDIFIKNHMKLDKSNIDFLPVRTTNEIARIFSTLNTQSKIQTVSERPRNPKNMANKRQLEVIKHFKKNKKSEPTFKVIGDKYYYSQPLFITNRCLKCHGEKEEAPAIIRDNYDSAYGYKLGELRGIIDIEVSQTKLGLLLDENNDKRFFYVFLLMSMILTVGFIYARYSIKLSSQIYKSSLALEEINHTLEDRIQDEIEKNRDKDQKLFQQSRLAQMGEMISMIAHQWRQPLGSIASTVTNIQVKMDMDKFDLETKKGADACKAFLATKLSNIDSYVQSLSGTIDDFRNFYNPNKERKVININAPLQKALDIIKTSMHAQGIDIVKSYKSERALSLADGELMQVFLNIFKNAQDNFKEKKTDNASIMIETCDTAKGVEVKIFDNGGGIPEDIKMKIFDPYFSTKNEKNGTGLGLYMSKTIIEEHHDGKLTVTNRNNGVEFTIEIMKESE